MSACVCHFFNERRIANPVPADLELVLTQPQMNALDQLENADWFLWFVRRPMSNPAVPVLIDPSNSFTAMLAEDGVIVEDGGIAYRLD